MKKYIFFFWLSFSCFQLIAQKRFSEGSIGFDVTMKTDGKFSPKPIAYSQLIKGMHYRADQVSSIGKTTTIFDLREGSGAILREFGSQKILIPLDKMQWDSSYKKKQLIIFNIKSESKEILGYLCYRADAKLDNGSILVVYFTKELVPENSSMELQFPQLPGFILEYDSTQDNFNVNYKATSLNFDPVAIQKFDIPNKGYRILNYQENSIKN